MSWEMWPEADLKHFRHKKNMFWGSTKSIWGPKSPICESYELNLAIWRFQYSSVLLKKFRAFLFFANFANFENFVKNLSFSYRFTVFFK